MAGSAQGFELDPEAVRSGAAKFTGGSEALRHAGEQQLADAMLGLKQKADEAADAHEGRGAETRARLKRTETT
ncbi:hypothetical protein [Amycolatopsis minnesotensis]|uniref:MT0933-like antitoxin protein n=1 Tax=Amycolatopsis minnesotensis TaxID=337894 RepID=A0ABN2RB79_9PSEU